MIVNIGSAVCGKVEGAKSDLANTLLTQPVHILLGSVRYAHVSSPNVCPSGLA